MKSFCKKPRVQIIVAVLAGVIVTLIAVFSVSRFTQPKTGQEYVSMSGNYIQGKNTYKLTSYDAYAGKLGKQIGYADSDSQVFDIEKSGYIAVVKNGSEEVYELQTNVPINLNNEKVSTLVTDTKTITDSTIIKEVTDIISTGKQIDTPADAVVTKNLSLGILNGKIYLYYQLLTDVDHNCYIYDTVTGDTWKIDTNLVKQLGIK